jgi:glycerophosphoryl diester phosphodiesterase
MATNKGLKIFAHRGASGYRPENTLEAFALGLAQGADAIETDLVPTSDGRLILRHENALSTTTNVASQLQFKDRFRSDVVDDEAMDDWFSEDFTLAEIKQLRAIERLPELRSGSAKFDGQFQVPTVAELLEADSSAGKTLVLELKHGDHFEGLGIDLPKLLAAELARVDWQACGIKLIFESFDERCLLRTKELLPNAGEFVFLTELKRLPAPPGIHGFLQKIAQQFDGISVDLEIVLNSDFVAQAHAAGLSVYTYTARVEEAEFSVEEYFHHLVETGVDGIFADQPDLLRNFVGASA